MPTNEQALIESIEGYGYNKQAIAKALGVSPSTVTRMSQGKFSASSKTKMGMAVSPALFTKLENLLAYAKANPKKSKSVLILPIEKPKETEITVRYIPVADTRLDDFMSPETEIRLSPKQRAIREIETGRYREVYNPRTNSREIIPYSATAAFNVGLMKHEPPIYQHETIREYCTRKIDSTSEQVRKMMLKEFMARTGEKAFLLARPLTEDEYWTLIKDVVDLPQFNSTLTASGYNPVAVTHKPDLPTRSEGDRRFRLAIGKVWAMPTVRQQRVMTFFDTYIQQKRAILRRELTDIEASIILETVIRLVS